MASASAAMSTAATVAAIMSAAAVITAVTGIAVMAPAVVAKKTDFHPAIVVGGATGISRFGDTPGKR